MTNEEKLMKLKDECITKANRLQEQADVWYAKARKYNDKLVLQMLKRCKKK